MHARRMPTTEGETIQPLSHWRMFLVGFEPNAIRLVAKQLTNGQCRLKPKASGKMRVLYISLCNIRWLITSGVWENNERFFCIYPNAWVFSQNRQKHMVNPFTFGRNLAIFGTFSKVNFHENCTSNEAQTKLKTCLKV